MLQHASFMAEPETSLHSRSSKLGYKNLIIFFIRIPSLKKFTC
jgi:hypothetical protein